MSATKILFTAVLCLFFLPHLYAATAEEQGFQIAKKMEEANKGFKGETSDMEMILINAYKEKIQRKMRGIVSEVLDDGDKSLITFLHPADVKETKMLTWAHKNNDDEQWLYLPAMKKIKRISSKTKSSSFMGSEFSYEDLGSQAIEKYNYKLVSEDDKTWILERYPKAGKESGYSKQILWVLKSYISSSKIEYYDRKNELLKTAVFNDYKSYIVNGKTLWRPTSIHMINTQTKKESVFIWENRQLGVTLKERDFDQANLK